MPHFTYATELSQLELMQGDVLQRTPAINQLLQQVHPHYADPKNLYFMVLTQSCDLAIHRPATVCKARYITVAPVRALDLVVDRHLEQLGATRVKAELPVFSAKAKSKVSEFLNRLFNNNEPGYFFLDREETPLSENCVAFLNLSIALRANEHFQECVDAKILQLTDTFQAKLGWLVGQMYSRVGTKDWDAEALRRKTREALDGIALFVEDKKVEALEAAYASLQTQAPGTTMTQEQVSKTLRQMPTLKQQVLAQINSVVAATIAEAKPDLAAAVSKRLEADAAITALLNR